MQVCGIRTDHVPGDYRNVVKIVVLGGGNALDVIAELLRFLERLAGELTGNGIVCLAGAPDQVEGHSRKLGGSTALQEKHLIVIGNIHQLAKHNLGILDDSFIVRRSMGHLHN